MPNKDKVPLDEFHEQKREQIKLASNEKEMEQLFKLRKEVFVLEQNVPQELEIDEYDDYAIQVVALKTGIVVGCGRLIIKDGYSKIGRLAVKRDFRKQGIGKNIMYKLIDLSKDQKIFKIILDAQLHAVPFYRALGFIESGDVFWEAGIKHISMVFDCHR